MNKLISSKHGFLSIDNLVADDKIGSIRDQCGQVYPFLPMYIILSKNASKTRLFCV